jgi:hypothetical protein
MSMPQLRFKILVVLLITLPTLAFSVILFDVAGYSAAPRGRCVATERDGDFYLVSDREFPVGTGASIDWYLMLDVPIDRRRWLKSGEMVRVRDVPSGERHARVEILSGPNKGGIGWLHRDMITPHWLRVAIRDTVILSLVAFIGVLLLAFVCLIRWLIGHHRAALALVGWASPTDLHSP